VVSLNSEFIERLDIDVYLRICTLQSDNDKKSLLAIQKAVREIKGAFAYLEIGSYMGGTLQPFLLDDLCTRVYSIDSWPDYLRDEVSVSRKDPRVSLEGMMSQLTLNYENQLHKLVTLVGTSITIEQDQIAERPTLLFIDGEHTNRACFDDFKFCALVAESNSVIVFHDSDIVFGALAECHTWLKTRGANFHAYNLPDTIGVIEIGEFNLYRHPAVLECLSRNQTAFIHCLSQLVWYRDKFSEIRALPCYETLRRIFRFFKGSNSSPLHK